MKYFKVVSRFLLGIVFIFSGFVKAVDPLANETQYEYDETTLLQTAEIDALGGKTNTERDHWGNIVRTSSHTPTYSASGQRCVLG